MKERERESVCDIYHHQLNLEMDSLLKQVEKHLNNMRLEPRESMELYISKPFPISSFLKTNSTITCAALLQHDMYSFE